MKWKVLNSCILSLFIFFYASQVFSQTNDILVLTEEWAPYNYSENNEIKGFSVELVQNIMRIIGKNYSIHIHPGVRSKYILDNTPRSIMFSLLRIPERENQYKWIGPLTEESIYFYKKRDNNIIINSIEDAKKVNIISCRYAGLIPDMLKRMGFSNLDLTATDSTQVYRKLILNRCDLAISDTDLGMAYQLRKMNYPKEILERTSVKVLDTDLYIACSKDFSDDEIIEWQKALDLIKLQGIFTEIYNKYY